MMAQAHEYQPLPSGAVPPLAANLHSPEPWEVAAWLAASDLGLRSPIKVFPWPRADAPVKSARTKASSEIGAIRAWSHVHGDRAVGVRTGVASGGLIVVAADDAFSLVQAEERYGELPPTTRAESRTGKLRVWLALTPGVVALPTLQTFAPGVRILGDGGACRLGRWSSPPDHYGLAPLPMGWVQAAEALAEPPRPNVRYPTRH